jgi:lysozyme family protein
MYIKKAFSWKIPNFTIAARATATAPPPQFLVCLPYTLKQECPDPADWSNPANFSDDPHDPGGATMCGIIQVEYDAYRKSLGEPTQSVRLITQAEGDAIYHTSYWQPDCPQLQVGLDLSYFDSSVNMGREEATRLLQRSLGVSDDGMWGPVTAGAVTAITNVSAVINSFTSARKTAYESFSTFQYFGRDWIDRATTIGDQSLQMVGSS